MTPNPFSGLLHSRKFWLMIMDITASAVMYFAGKYAGASAFEDIKFLLFAIQPVIISVIIGITLEDRALIAASVYTTATTYSSSEPTSGTPIVK